MRAFWCFGACVVLIAGLPALGVGGTDPWTDGWYVNGDLSRSGINDSNVTTFAPGDPRLGRNTGNNGTTSGGMHWSYDEHGPYNGQDNVRVLVNRDLAVPAGTYNFQVSLKGYVYWNVWDVNSSGWQPWGLGQSWFIGDPAAMDYGFWPAGGEPEGPWKGSGWASEGNTRLYRQFNGTLPDDTPIWEDASPNGFWLDYTWSQTQGGTTAISTTGKIIFRMASQFKVRNWAGETMTVAMDDLSITLTPVGGGDPIVFTDAFLPEPTSLVLLGLGALPLFRRRRR